MVQLVHEVADPCCTARLAAPQVADLAVASVPTLEALALSVDGSANLLLTIGEAPQLGVGTIADLGHVQHLWVKAGDKRPHTRVDRHDVFAHWRGREGRARSLAIAPSYCPFSLRRQDDQDLVVPQALVVDEPGVALKLGREAATACPWCPKDLGKPGVLFTAIEVPFAQLERLRGVLLLAKFETPGLCIVLVGFGCGALHRGVGRRARLDRVAKGPVAHLVWDVPPAPVHIVADDLPCVLVDVLLPQLLGQLRGCHAPRRVDDLGALIVDPATRLKGMLEALLLVRVQVQPHAMCFGPRLGVLDLLLLGCFREARLLLLLGQSLLLPALLPRCEELCPVLFQLVRARGDAVPHAFRCCLQQSR